ncbi:MAG: hypothetical protein ISR65_00830 [Bacteriovoracaceae bacterium]|nr:hypothetical protein [Bacteriovoracaceae bacterium]
MNIITIPGLPIPNMIFFPHTVVSVQISHPIHKKTVEHCIANDLPLAIFPTTTTETSIYCGIGNPNILEEQNGSGEQLVIIKGIGKVHLLNTIQHLPFPMFNAELVYDIDEKQVFDNCKISRLKDILNKWIVRNIPDSVERQNFIDQIKTVHHITDYVSTFLIHDLELKNMLLQNDSLAQRIQTLNALLKDSNPFYEDYYVTNALKTYWNDLQKAQSDH